MSDECTTPLVEGEGGGPVGLEHLARSPAPITESVGHVAGGQTPTEVIMEELIAYGGIQDPTSGDRRVSHWIHAQPDADDL